MKFSLINFIALFLLMVTGVFWGTWFPLSQSLESFSASEFISIGKVIIANVAMPMAFLMPACIMFMIISTLMHTNKYSNSFYFGGCCHYFYRDCLVCYLNYSRTNR